MRKTLLAVSLAALGLSACSSLDGKTPQEMMQISMARSLKQDYSYDFSGEGRVYLSKQADGVAPEAAALMRERAAAQEVAQAAAGDSVANQTDGVDNLDADMMAALFGEGRMGGEMADTVQQYPGLAQYIANGRLNYSGAVDLRAQLMEFVPELVLNGRNERLSVKAPLLFDGKDLSVTADLPDSLPMILNFFVDPPMRERLLREPIRIALSEKDKQGIPVRHVVHAAVYAAYKAYGALPQQAFKPKEMDSFGKQAGGRYRLELVMDKDISKAYYDAGLREFLAKLDELEQASPEAGATPEGYEKVRKVSREMMESVTAMDASEIYGSPLFSSFYLDRKGRLVGLRQYMQFDGSKGQALNIDSNLKLFNFGKPTFTFKPQQAKTIAFTDLMASINKQREAKSAERYARYGSRYGAEDVMAEIETPAQPNVIEEKVLAK